MAATLRRTGGPSSQRPTTPELPSYQRPKFPLNRAAQRQLAQLLRTHSLNKLDESTIEAQKRLEEAAGETNDRLTRNERLVQSKQKGNASTDDDDGFRAREQSLTKMREVVQKMTQNMDERLRKLIDGQYEMERLRASINTVADSAQENANTQASLPARSMRQRRSSPDASAEDEANNEPAEFTPTDPGAGTQRDPPAFEAFRTRMEDEMSRYQNTSLVARYGESSAYSTFKRVIHDALHPDGDVEPPPPSQWFHEGTVPPPGVRIPGAVNDDDDDDLAVSRAIISTKCPLTLLEMTDPLTSRKCPHSFESSAILAFIRESGTQIPVPQGPRGRVEKAVQCPVQGCAQQIAQSDLHKDAVLVRRIKRLQQLKITQENGHGEDDDQDNVPGTQRSAYVIDDDNNIDDGFNELLVSQSPEP